jgi:hypothetical protein
MECSFRKQNDPNNRLKTLGAEFAKRWQVPHDGMVDNMVMGTALAAKIEALYEQELTPNAIPYYRQLEQRTGIRFLPHSWLRGYKFIGEVRSITSTIRRLQEFGSAVHFRKGHLQLTENGRLITTRHWNEHDKKAKKIQHDLDQFLIGDALPTLVSMCLEGMLSIDLPQEGELLSFFSELKSYLKNPLKSLSWSTAFAVHLLLTSVLQVQGQDDIQTIGMEARNCFDRYMEQINWVNAHGTVSTLSLGVEGERPQPWPVTMANLKKINFLFRPHTFPAELTQADRELQTMLACWNPLCAGSFMLYTMYFCNLGGGVGMVDYMWQLRMVLHLFNAFRCHKVIRPGEVELLDWLHQQFLESKSIWEGGIPGKGQLTYRWRLAVGHTPTDARRQSEDSDRRLQHLREETVTPARSRARQAHDVTRKHVRSLGAQDCTSSYTRICLRDFANILPAGSSSLAADLGRTAPNIQMFQHSVRVGETLAAMGHDERVLATNLVCLGEILDQFVVSFFRMFDFAPFFDKDEWLRTVKNSNGGARSSRRGLGRRATAWEESEDNIERQGTLLGISEMILPVLDFHPESQDYETIPTMAAFMADYFNGVDRNNLMIFNPRNTTTKTNQAIPAQSPP